MTPAHPHGRPDVVFRRMGDEWVLFDPDSLTVHALNLTSALIWEHCDGTHDAAAIAAVVRESFSGTIPDTVDADVARILTTFREAGLFRS